MTQKDQQLRLLIAERREGRALLRSGVRQRIGDITAWSRLGHYCSNPALMDVVDAVDETVYSSEHPHGGAGTYFFKKSATRVYASIWFSTRAKPCPSLS